MTRHFGIFAKRPQAGQVKTRLATDLGDAVAVEFYAAFLEDLIERFRGVADRRCVGIAPDDEPTREYFRELCEGDYELWPQPETDLGGRMTAFFETACDAGASRIVLIGSDSPTLPAEYIEDAFALLETADCVLGPATDGGYYLIGFRRWPGSVLNGIQWSGPQVLSQTVRNLRAAGYHLRLLPMWYDVDTIDDLQTLHGHLAALALAGQPQIAPATARMTEKYIATFPTDL